MSFEDILYSTIDSMLDGYIVTFMSLLNIYILWYYIFNFPFITILEFLRNLSCHVQVYLCGPILFIQSL